MDQDKEKIPPMSGKKPQPKATKTKKSGWGSDSGDSYKDDVLDVDHSGRDSLIDSEPGKI